MSALDLPIPRAPVCQFIRDDHTDPICGKPVQRDSPYCTWHHIVCHRWSESLFKAWAAQASPAELPTDAERAELLVDRDLVRAKKAVAARPKGTQPFTPLSTTWGGVSERNFGGVYGTDEGTDEIQPRDLRNLL